MKTLKNFYNWLTDSKLREDVDDLKFEIYDADSDDNTLASKVEFIGYKVDNDYSDFKALLKHLKLVRVITGDEVTFRKRTKKDDKADKERERELELEDIDF